MLRQSKVFREGAHMEDRIMDSNALERERGITILSKNTAVRFKVPTFLYGSSFAAQLLDFTFAIDTCLISAIAERMCQHGHGINMSTGTSCKFSHVRVHCAGCRGSRSTSSIPLAMQTLVGRLSVCSICATVSRTLV